MDWTTIRVLTDNLGQLLDQYESCEYLDASKSYNGMGSRVKTEWWVGIRSLTVSLAEVLNIKLMVNHYEDSFREGQPLLANYYTEHAVALVALGRKLLTDLDAATSATCAEKSSAASH